MSKPVMDYQSIKEFTQKLLYNYTFDGLISIKEKEYQTQMVYHFEIHVYYTPFTQKPIPKESIVNIINVEHTATEIIKDDIKLEIYEELYHLLLIWAVEKAVETKQKLEQWQK